MKTSFMPLRAAEQSFVSLTLNHYAMREIIKKSFYIGALEMLLTFRGEMCPMCQGQCCTLIILSKETNNQKIFLILIQ